MTTASRLKALGATRAIHATEIGCYLRCPMAWWIEYIMQLEIPEEDKPAPHRNRIAGSVAHEVVCRWHGVGTPEWTLADVAHFVSMYWTDEESRGMPYYPTKEPREKCIEELSTALWNYTQDPVNNPALVGFELIANETAYQAMVGAGKKYLCRGRVDQVRYYPETGKTLLLDLKWSTTPAESRSVEWDHQLTLYGHLAMGQVGEFHAEHRPGESFTIKEDPITPLSTPPDEVGILSLRGYLPYKSSRKDPAGGYVYQKGTQRPDSARWTIDRSPDWPARLAELSQIIKAMRFGIHPRRDSRSDGNGGASPCMTCDYRAACFGRAENVKAVSLPAGADAALAEVGF